MKFFERIVVMGVVIAALCTVQAQTPPPPPPPPNPIPPLGLPPVPPENPVTPAKANLGKTLFWDEQLSSTKSMACGTCHQPSHGGADQRTVFGVGRANNPGPDANFGNSDDIFASPGVPQNDASGAYVPVTSFGIREQVGRRRAPSNLNAGFPQQLFWDGRAGDSFVDPITNVVIAPHTSALEQQVLGPPVSSVEMGHLGRDWNDVATRIASVTPLALSPQIPAPLAGWIAQRSYAQLFNEAFGSAEVTPVRIAMAIATYERTLNTDQAPIDLDTQAAPKLTLLEQQGRQVFAQVGCAACHAGPRLTDDRFHYTGVRPTTDDEGRFEVTADDRDRGAMKTPELRNLELHAPYMHNGRFQTLEEVVDFYNRGGDFTAPNKDRRIHPLNLSQAQKDALVAFMKRPLTDPRVTAQQAPFDRPLLYTESDRRAHILGVGTEGGGAVVPHVDAFEPPVLGNPSFTVGIFDGLGGAKATLVIDSTDPGSGPGIPSSPSFAIMDITLSGTAAGNGVGSVTFAISNDPSLVGKELFGRWFVADPDGAGGVAVTAAFHFTVFTNSPAIVAEGEGEGEGATEGEGEGEGAAEGEGEGASEGEGEGEGAAEGEGEGEGELYTNSCDQNHDGKLDLSELLRAVQFLNSGGFHCDPTSEDGYAPGAGDTSCGASTADYNPQDWRIGLSELLRVVQFYNLGGYKACPGQNTEDGYCAGANA